MRVVPAICLMLVLSGCDFVYGVSRNATLNSLPSLACVEKVVRETPGVATVETRVEPGGRPLTLTGIHDPDQNYYFIYHGSEGSYIWGALLLSRRYDGTAELLQDNERLNDKPPQAEIDASRPVMRKIELSWNKIVPFLPLRC
jgi:hypothetical protein